MVDIGLFQRNTLHHGRSEILMAGVPDESIDFTITSCPYDDMDLLYNPIPSGTRDYEGYVWNFKEIANQLWRITKPGGVVVWNVWNPTIDGKESMASTLQKLYFFTLGFRVHATMYYKVVGSGAKGSKYTYNKTLEYVFVFSKGRPKSINLIRDKRNLYAGEKTTGERLKADGSKKKNKSRVINQYSKRDDVWEVQNATFDDHPAPMPPELARGHIMSWTSLGDIVFDPFVGRGTSAIEAYQLGRDYLGFDCSKTYINRARVNVSEANTPLFINDSGAEKAVISDRQQLRLL